MPQTDQGLRMLDSIYRIEFETFALLIERQTKGWSHLVCVNGMLCRERVSDMLTRGLQPETSCQSD